MRRRNRLGAATTASCALLALSYHASAQTNITWNGSPGGLWSVAGNWNPNQVPQNGFATPVVAIVNTPGPFVDGVFNIIGLTVNDRVLHNEGSQLGFRHPSGTGDTFINGNGSISIMPGGTSSSAIVMGGIGTLNLSGNGLISMGGAGLARINGPSGATLNNTSWRIEGEGNFIEGFVALRNNGTITASGGTLVINAGPYVNTRMMRAAANSTLVIRGGFGDFDNTGGTIHADGGHVQISNGLNITGGTLSTANGGSISPGGGGVQTFRLTDVTNAGHYVATGATVTQLAGTITNNGSVTLEGAMRAIGTLTLAGAGTINMQPGSVFLAGPGGVAIVNQRNTIQGSGQLGSDSLAIINEDDGVIHANGSLTINPGTLGMGNTGRLSVAPGGTLVLSGLNGGSFINTGGRIEVASTGKVRLGGNVEIEGGTFAAEDDFENAAFTVDNATLRTVTMNASLDLIGTLIVDDQIDGNGNLHGRPNATIRIRNAADLNLSSGIVMDQGVRIEADPAPAPGPDGIPQVFNNGLIRGQGNIGNNGLQVTNNGTIRADAGVAGDPRILTIDPSPEGCLNAGIMESTNFGVLQLTSAGGGGAFDQTGMALIRALGANSNVRLSGSQISITGGQFGAGAGSISVDGGTVATLTDLTSDAFLTTTGLATILINNNVNNTGTVALPGGARLVVTGASTLNSGSGHILNNGSVTISSNGNLDANFIDGVGRTTVQSGGTLRAHAIRQNVLDVQAGGFAHLKSSFTGSVDPSRVGSLSVGAAPAFLDVANRVLVIDQSGAMPLNALRAHIINGYNGGAWNGPGIRSGVAAANPGHGIGFGEASAIFASFPATYFDQTVDATTLLVTFTRYGDANLDRVVNLQDFNRLAANFGGANRNWTDGDFTFDGVVNLLDFNRMAANFGLSAAGAEVTPADWAALAAAVPEPCALLPLLGFSIRRRSRKYA